MFPEWHPAMVWLNCFWNNFRKETEKTQAARLMNYISSEWNAGREVSKEEIDRLEFFLYTIRMEQELNEYDHPSI